MPRLASPYLPLTAPCHWRRGNGPAHSTVSDGACSPETVVSVYAALSRRPGALQARPAAGTGRAWHTARSLATPHVVQAVAGPTLTLNVIDVEGRLFDTAILSKAHRAR